jgi:aspartyl-tRNA synthetase
VLRHKMAQEVRKYLDGRDFIEVETPVLIKSTPEGARDFVVPSRMNPGEFYALPQSPQTFKQLLMVSGFDRYFQIVKCFRDEDLRADRQPEFTQIDCEMSFITQEDILNIFEGLTHHLFKTVKGIDIGVIPRMEYADAMRLYGSDKPDIRFGMEFVELNDIVKGNGFSIFDNAELIVGINAKGCAEYTRKQIDELTEWLKRPQIGVTGMIYCRYNTDGTLKSSVDKFYTEDDLTNWAAAFEAEPGDIMLVLAGQADKVRKQLNELRLEMGNRLGLRDKNVFAPLWVLDFPLLEWDEESGRYHAMHHPFTSPKPQDIPMLDIAPGEVRANAYDLVINGTEIGGGSIRIHDRALQSLMFKHLGFTPEDAQKQFGFLMDAFEYGAPPHGGIAFGFDRLVSIFAGLDSIRDVIAFPKNNSGRDVMIDTPSEISDAQLKELYLIEDLTSMLIFYTKLNDERAARILTKISKREKEQQKQRSILKNKLDLRGRHTTYFSLNLYKKQLIDKLKLSFVHGGSHDSLIDEKGKLYSVIFKRKRNFQFKNTDLLKKINYLILGVMNNDYEPEKVFKIDLQNSSISFASDKQFTDSIRQILTYVSKENISEIEDYSSSK